MFLICRSPPCAGWGACNLAIKRTALQQLLVGAAAPRSAHRHQQDAVGILVVDNGHRGQVGHPPPAAAGKLSALWQGEGWAGARRRSDEKHNRIKRLWAISKHRPHCLSVLAHDAHRFMVMAPFWSGPRPRPIPGILRPFIRSPSPRAPAGGAVPDLAAVCLQGLWHGKDHSQTLCRACAGINEKITAETGLCGYPTPMAMSSA